jgi:2',3'-cyclic-nucleotide 2'-phosphodiesterase (5'-nucleotidase family)
VFANTGTCEYLPKDKLKDAGELVEYRFHNKPVKPNLKVKAIYEQEWVPKMADFLKVLVESEVDLVTQSNQECELANLVTTLMMEAVPSADFVIINPGGLRTEWYPGYIQEQHFYNMFPFENYLESFDIMGSELLKMLEIVQNGPLGFYHTAGLKITVSANGGNNHRFINATLINEEPIIPDRQYRGMSIDFLLQGGDDFKEVMGKVYTLRNPKTEGSIKDLIRPKLIDL